MPNGTNTLVFGLTVLYLMESVHIKMARLMKDSGEMQNLMEKELKYGLMVNNMRVTGKMGKPYGVGKKIYSDGNFVVGYWNN